MNHTDSPRIASSPPLKVSGLIGTAAIQRGMAVVDFAGRLVGLVAGVIVEAGSEQVSAIVIGRLPPTDDYRLAPVALVTAVDGEQHSLSLATDLESLSRHIPK